MDDRPWAKNNDDHDDDVHDGDGDDKHFFHLGISNISHQPPNIQTSGHRTWGCSRVRRAGSQVPDATCRPTGPVRSNEMEAWKSFHSHPPGSILVLTYTLVNQHMENGTFFSDASPIEHEVLCYFTRSVYLVEISHSTNWGGLVLGSEEICRFS